MIILFPSMHDQRGDGNTGTVKVEEQAAHTIQVGTVDFAEISAV